MTRATSFPARCGLLAASLAAALLVCEIGLYLMGIGYPLVYVPDPYCGSRLQPGLSAWFTSEGRAHVRINRHGFRDQEHAIQKPRGTLRIAVLGDSYAEALQVPLEQTFWSVLEQELSACPHQPDRRVEVLNFGVSGYGTGQQLQAWRHHVWPYEPDLVLLAIFAGNDISDNSRRLYPHAVRPYFVLDGGRLVRDDSFREHPDYVKAQRWSTRVKVAAINRSRVLQTAARWRARRHLPAADPAPALPELSEPGIDLEVYRVPAHADWVEAWQITERLITTLRDEVRVRGAEFRLVVLTTPAQVHPDSRWRAEACAALGVPDLSYADRRIAALAEAEDIPCLLLAPPLSQYADRHRLYLHGFARAQWGRGHWNVDGHRAAGELIGQWLCQTWQPSPAGGAAVPADNRQPPSGP